MFSTDLFVVRQGDVRSTTLFSIYINYHAKESKCFHLGIPVDILVSIFVVCQ